MDFYFDEVGEAYGVPWCRTLRPALDANYDLPSDVVADPPSDGRLG